MFDAIGKATLITYYPPSLIMATVFIFFIGYDKALSPTREKPNLKLQKKWLGPCPSLRELDASAVFTRNAAKEEAP